MPDSGSKIIKISPKLRPADSTKGPDAPAPVSRWEATDLAKAAVDVIALNRHTTASSVRVSEDTHRGPRVSSLGNLRCGLKIRKDDIATEESSAQIRSLVKE